MDMITENKVVPKLRFKEFKDSWFIDKFSKYIKLYRGSSPRPISKYRTKNNGVNWIKIGDTKKSTNYEISSVEEQITFEGSLKSRKVEVGELILANSMSFGKTYKLNISGCIYDGWFVLREYQDDFYINFLHQLLNSNYMQKQYIRFSTGGVVQNISSEIVYSTKICKPNLYEQQKIASFLSAIDEKLQQLTKKKELLEDYKKGIMQKIFSQEIRFKDDSGNNYPDWQEKKLGQIGKTFNGLTGKTKKDFGNGKPFIQYMQIFSSAKIDKSKFGFVNLKENEKQNKVRYGDVFFTTSSETPLEIGYASVLTEEIEELYLNSFCFGFRANSLSELYPDFASYLFRSQSLRKQIVKLAQGSTRYNMSKVQLLKILVKLPSLKEQKKIADFLTLIDNKIENTLFQLEKTKEFKKGLLQQMFV